VVIGALNPGCSATPEILGVYDVGNDQGGQVRVEWYSPCDFPNDRCTITSHGLTSDGFYEDIPAAGDRFYQYVAPTVLDSPHVSVFEVVAYASGPGCASSAWSGEVGGWSVDNLEPSAPENLRMTSPVELAWDANTEPDVALYSVYGSYAGDIGEDAVLIGHTESTTMDVSGFGYPVFLVTASDSSGNESEASSLENSFAGVPSDECFERPSLRHSRPNPFSSETHITFDLAKSSNVRLEIYDVSGKKVMTLIDKAYPPGRHTAVWDGLDESGNEAGPGIYFITISAGVFKDTKKVTVVR
jgi:hypothetical protein